ncbi:hypothetical protein CI791_07420 [Leuconostoc lactis]|uniref:phage tail protein n=1 Tax=Leuconostoc lactis TaxID=1246 RepID=UPI000BABBD98|nr:tape measure protein [Leuconostoc lactis]PAV33078.1 hypothetical protein CI791_07420 [Leuconostoc lactis]
MASYSGGNVTAHIGADISDYQSAMRSVASVTQSAMNNTSAATQGATSKFSDLTSSIGRIAAGVGVFALVSQGIGVLKNSVGSAVARFDTLNSYPKVMKQMGYSTEDTNKSVGILKKGVDGLPTSLQELTKSAQSFAILEKNATKGAQTATALNDAFLASGASAGDASRGVEQYSQMLATGTVDMQSWRTLQETMPYALTKVANSFGLTGKSAERDLYAKLKSGQITMEQLNARFVELDGGANGFANTARTASNGIGTSFTNMKNAVTNGMANMLTAIDNGLKSAGLGGIAAIFDQVKQGIIFSFAAINGAVQAGMAVIGGAIKNMAGIFTTVLRPALAFAKQGFDIFVQGTITALQPISGLLNHIKNDIDRSFNAGSATSAFIGAFSQVINVLTMVRTVIIDVVKGFLDTNAVQAVWQAIVSVVTAVFNIFQTLVVAVGNIIGSFQGVDSSKSIWESLGTTIGNIVTVVADVVKAVGDFVNKILSIPGATDAISALAFGTGAVVVAFKVVGTAVSVAATGINMFKTAVSVARGVMLAFNTVLAANPLGIIVVAITAVVAGLVWFFTQTQTGQAIWSSFVNFLTEAWNNFSAAISVITQAIVDGMQAAWNVLVAVLEAPVITVIAFINGGFSGLMTSVSSIWSGIVNNLGIIWNNIVTIASSIFPGLGTLISNIFLAIGNFFAAWGTGILEFITIVFNGIINVITSVVNGVLNVIVSVWNGIPGFISGLWNGIVNFLSGLWSGLVGLAVGFANNFFNGIRVIWNGITGWVSSLWNGVKSTISGVWNGIVSTVTSLANSAINGLKGAWNGITGWVSGLWNGVKSTIRSAMNFDLGAAGRAIMDSFLGGLKAAWEGVKSFVGGIANWIKDHKGPISYDRKLLIPAGKAIMDGFGGSLNANFATVKQSVSSYAGQISDEFGKQQYVANAQLTTSSTGVAGQINGGLSALSDKVAEQQTQAPVFQVFNEIIGDKITTTVNTKNARRQATVQLMSGGV